MGLKTRLKNKLVNGLKRVKILDNDIYTRNCYSQEGEDVLLERIIGSEIIKGFFIDIGAHHPIKFSNTYLFYKKGWRGINIDAMPGSMNAFNEYRWEDTNLEIPVSDVKEKLTYYIFNHPEVNTFVKENAEHWNGKWGVKIVEEKELETVSISEILKRYYNQLWPIDILSIDVEGMDFKILKSIDLNEYLVKFIIIEEGEISLDQIIEGEIYKYLLLHGYKLISKLHNSSIYRKN